MSVRGSSFSGQGPADSSRCRPTEGCWELVLGHSSRVDGGGRVVTNWQSPRVAFGRSGTYSGPASILESRFRFAFSLSGESVGEARSDPQGA